MIIVKLTGGLGNQLFQYAFARHLSIKHQVETALDIRELGIDEKGEQIIRNYGLNNFNINAVIASDSDLKAYSVSKLTKLVDLFCLSIGLKFKKMYVREPFFHFYRNAMNAPADSYLDGYWQSEKYFAESQIAILNDLRLISELSTETKHIASQIVKGNAVSIHVRRGDYLSVAENVNIYANCSEQYYISAMKKIFEEYSDAEFYVFSDDPEWVKRNLKSDYKMHFVSHNSGKNSYQDIYLMSLCKHNIIANSSFSWWGAWLNLNKNKIVIAPKNWFKNNAKNTKDLIPNTWLQL